MAKETHITDMQKRERTSTTSHILVRKIERTIVAVAFIISVSKKDSVYKVQAEQHVAALLVSLKCFAKEMSFTAFNEVRYEASVVHALLRLLVATGCVRADLVALVQDVLMSALEELARLWVSETDVPANELHVARVQEILTSSEDGVNDVGGVRMHTEMKTQFAEQRNVRVSTVRVQKSSARSLSAVQPRVREQRTEDIYMYIKEAGRVTVPQVAARFTEVSGKTIQRELVSLLLSGRITKTGDRRWTVYSLPPRVDGGEGARVAEQGSA